MGTLLLVIAAFVIGGIVGSRYLAFDRVREIWLWLTAAVAAVGAFAKQIFEMIGG